MTPAGPESFTFRRKVEPTAQVELPAALDASQWKTGTGSTFDPGMPNVARKPKP
jgi:hypothetical protein